MLGLVVLPAGVGVGRVAGRLDVAANPSDARGPLDRRGPPADREQLKVTSPTAVGGEDLGQVVPEREHHGIEVGDVAGGVQESVHGSSAFLVVNGGWPLPDPAPDP
eukprot:7971192-Pyramimonas_sp.AAC.1